jgi:nucleoside-diphosphate-sugar epimerase
MVSSLYLIPGGAGFLGINLCRELLAKGHRVRTLDIAPIEYPERASVEVVDGDIRDEQAVASLTQTGTTHRVPWKNGALQLAKYCF